MTEAFVKELDTRLEGIEQKPGVRNNVPPEKLILCILDYVRMRNFDGVISIKIREGRIFDPRIEQTRHLELEYRQLD